MNQAIDALIKRIAAERGVSPDTLRAFVQIESGGNPDARTGSYRGLLQMSPAEFAKYGGSGDIYDPAANLSAGAAKLAAESADFANRYGRPPAAADLYMMHQQGAGGAAAHMARPDAPAWENMAGTAEGRQKGADWAKRAIWGNVPDDVKAKFGSVENMTSKDFTDMWAQKVARMGGNAAPEVMAAAPPGVSAGASPPPSAHIGSGGSGMLSGMLTGSPLSGLLQFTPGTAALPKPDMTDEPIAMPNSAVARKPMDMSGIMQILNNRRLGI